MFGSCLEIIFFLTGRQHSQSCSLPDEKETDTSSEPPPPTSFSSLPYDIILNGLARVPRFYRPTLALVSRDFRSLIASPELEATRLRIGITEEYYLCVCLNLKKDEYNPDPRWFTLSPIPKQQKLIHMPWFPYKHPVSSTVLSIGSEIYIIGGYVKGRRSRSVLVLDCLSHQCRRLPNMRQPRVSAAADVIDGKIYVIGGYNMDDWGEVYDPKNKTWEPLLPTSLDLTTQKSVVPGKLVMGGKVYDMDDLSQLHLERNICLVEIEKVLCLVSVCKGMLLWCDPGEEDSGWSRVKGLEGLPRCSYFSCYLVSVANSIGGRRVTVWWKSVVFGRLGRNWTKECKTEIWCAEILFERRGFGELWGSVEWSKNVFTFDGSDSPFDFFLHSACVTY